MIATIQKATQLPVLLLAAMAWSAPACAQKAVLVRDIDRFGNGTTQVFECDVAGPAVCLWLGGPTPNPSPNFVVRFVSYKVSFTAATKVTSVGIACGPGVDYLPLGREAVDDGGNHEISWAGPVMKLVQLGCSGVMVVNGSNTGSVTRYQMRVHGYFDNGNP